MGVHTGKWGAVNGVDTVRDWSISESTQAKTFVASNTRHGTGRKKGVREWSGSFNRYGGLPLHMPGESFTFQGYTAPDDDMSGAGVTYEGVALVESVALTWNWEAAEILSHVTNFQGHLALTVGSGEWDDTTIPDVPSTIDCLKPEFGADVDASPTELPNVTQITLTLNNALQSYVNSDTVINGVAWTGRKSGPAIDWTAQFSMQDNVRVSPMPVISSDYQFRLYIDDTDYWELFWGHVQDYTGLTVSRESGAILAAQMNVGMNGFLAGVVGRIRVPGTPSTDWWPAA